MTKKKYLFILFIMTLFCICNNCYCLNKEYYDYNGNIRILKDDPIIAESIGGGDIEASKEALKAFSYIPGINTLALPLAYMVQVGIINNISNITVSEDISAISDVAMIGGMITDVLSPSDAESGAAIAIQQTFNTNLYCKHQKFYIEEDEYVSKQKSTSGGGYSVFPVYPMDIPINESTGQCDVNDSLLNRYFIDGQLIPVDSRCSYAYSATSDQCIKDLDIPILLEYSFAQLTVEGVCLVGSIRGISKQAKESAEKIAKDTIDKLKDEVIEKYGDDAAEEILNEIGEKAAEKEIKKAKKAGIEEIIETIARIGVLTGTQLFFDSRLAFDPIMMYAIIQIELAIDFVINLPQDLMDQNWPCVVARPAGLVVLDSIVKTTVAITMSEKHKEAKKAIQNITFCGYDWLSYTKTNDSKYYIRGMFEHSRYKNVSDCINGSNCVLTNETICKNADNYQHWCDHITATSKNIKNKIFREYTYGGKEYEVIDKVENDIKEGDNRYEAMGYNPDYCIDPRLPEYKGFLSINQRYYMKGNEKANFACNRFFYNHNDGCVLPETDIEDSDKDKLILYTNANKVKYYIIDKSNPQMLDKYILACKNAFTEARQCCKYRSRHFVCLENKSNNHNKFCFSNVVDKYGDAENTSLFTYLSTRNTDNDKVTCTIDGYNFEASKKEKTNHVCVFSDGFCPYNFKLNAGLNYRASYCDANYFSNYKDHSDALKRMATQYNAADCREGLFSATMMDKYKKIHSNTGGEALGAYTHYKVKKDIMENFNYNANDFTTIYDFDRLVDKNYTGNLNTKDKDGNNITLVKTNYTAEELEYIKSSGFSVVQSGSDLEQYVLNSLDVGIANQIRTSAYGQIKNFCQYRAHCVEVEKEREYPEEFSVSASFLDSSCNGSSQHSRNILQTHNGGIPRQLSVPIVECVYESLKNLINGVAGMSSCVDSTALNADGYCDEDTKEIVEYNLKQKNSSFFEDRYGKVGDNYIVKGTVLPDDYNPFIKLQKYFINIVKTALCLFLVLYSYKKLILVEMDLLDRKNIVHLTSQVVKFSIVAYLVFSNGWRSGIYDYIVNFSTSAYDFVNRLFVKVVQNPKNQILNFNNPDGTVIKVVREDLVSGNDTDVTICYRYSFFNNIEFAAKDGTMCERGFKAKTMPEILISNNKDFPKQKNSCRLIISNNQEISKLLYYIDEYNKNTSQKLKIKVSTGGGKVTADSTSCIKRTSWNNVDSVDGGLWNEDYDGCYFDTTEYDNNKQYISFFDTLDCKMMKYFGYSTNSAVPNMLIYSAIMLLPQYFFPNMGILSKIVSGLGSMIFGLMLSFLFLMFNVILKAVYLFTSSFFILSILIFLSPIILPMMLFEKTKKYYNSWFEQVLGTVLKPSFGLALLILYVNLMDIMLIGDDVVFSKHNNIGRGADVICPDNAVSFFCLVNKNPAEAYEILTVIFSGGLLNLLTNIVIAFLFFKLSDSFLDELNGIINNIFTGIGNASSLTGIKGVHSGGTTDALNKAKTYGKKMEDFRQTYIGDSMAGAVEMGLHGVSDEKYNGVLRNTLLNSAGGHIGNLSKVGSKISSGIRTSINKNKLSRNEGKLNKLNNLQQEEQKLEQRRFELMQQIEETDGKLSEGEIKELVNINVRLEDNKSKQKELSKEKIEQSISREKDRLGIGDDSSGSRRIGEKSEKVKEFINDNLRFKAINNRIAKGVFDAKKVFKKTKRAVIDSSKKTINKTKDRHNNKYSFYHDKDAKDIVYMETNVKHLEKENSNLRKLININDTDMIKKQIQENEAKIEEILNTKQLTNTFGDDENSLIIEQQIEELEKENEQLKIYIDKTGIQQLEDKIKENEMKISELLDTKQLSDMFDDGDTIAYLQEQIDKLEKQNSEYMNKINKHVNFVNAKKMEFMDNYYTIEKQKQEIDNFYTTHNAESKYNKEDK